MVDIQFRRAQQGLEIKVPLVSRVQADVDRGDNSGCLETETAVDWSREEAEGDGRVDGSGLDSEVPTRAIFRCTFEIDTGSDLTIFEYTR